MSVFVVKLYQQGKNKVRYLKWIVSIKDKETKIRIQQRIRRLELGNLGNCKALKDGISELKLNFGPGYRIYYGIEEKTIILLLCGGDKFTQKEDIEKAKEYWQDYQDYKEMKNGTIDKI